ncbi:hypothetical protein SUGI_1011500 [Cryptomeria japonica]|uniref:uncharacterized protein LOC131044480 n=1 Tax=Cryptomeria japonica TaxID=3369 RepID=UPI0024146B16|nr:uncharacterized protein LOC131044480 [Cryptomeria japonica]XP_057833789.2 uncharacterized protein LOC131044480 [Cryptomeria japonica]XP_057833790.2 uncharacterized protein LOC131044480 [Cryptomeria japonica]GLJ47908.1 hypothetical protein SUGI_1011500 [Cryptomeria japonica]
MREARPWNAMDPISSLSSDDSSSSDSEEDEQTSKKDTTKKASNQSTLGGDCTAGKLEVERKKPIIDYEALSRHGYNGGPSVLKVPPPRPNEPVEQDWSWSGGKRKVDNEKSQEEESYEERERTRHAVTEGAVLSAVQGVDENNYLKKQKRELANEHKSISFSQKEKRKRDLGQASRGKNYVEEEKRLLRDQGVYSGFDK